MTNKISRYLKRSIKYLLIGRDIKILDKLIFKLTRGYSSGWVLGNKLRNLAYGRKKSECYYPVILIGGFPRSGTTFLQKILEQHPKIATTEVEVNILQDIKSKDILKKRFKNNKEEKGFMLTNKEIKELDLNDDLIKNACKILNKYENKNDGKRVLLKQPKHVFFLKEIFKYFPKSKFIHMIRDGRDATMSQRYYCLPKDRKEWPYDWCCRQWVTAIKRGRRFKDDDKYKEVRFENLLKQPNEVLNEVLEFLGLEKMNKIIFGEDSKKYPNHPNVGRKPDLGIISKGRRKMSERDKKVFKKIAGDMLIKLGYEEDNEW